MSQLLAYLFSLNQFVLENNFVNEYFMSVAMDRKGEA